MSTGGALYAVRGRGLPEGFRAMAQRYTREEAREIKPQLSVRPPQ